MVKIIHSGDIHLDSAYKDFPRSKAVLRSEEQFLSFQRIIAKTSQENADVLLLAGDLFENDFVTYKTAEFLKREFAKIPSTSVFISPGNHDCISGNEIYGSFDFGENVTVFSPQLTYKELPSLNLRVYGYGFYGKEAEADIICDLDKSFINILLIHASIPPFTDTNNISTKTISQSGFEYIAAGHFHTHDGFSKYGDTTAAYCGIPDGRFFDECGEKGFLYVEVEKNRVEGKFIKNSSRITDKVEVDISECMLSSDILEKLNYLEEKNLYEIVLKGIMPSGTFFDKKSLENILNEKFFFAKLVDKTEKAVVKEPGIAEEKFLKALESIDAHEDIIKRAKEIGLMALAGEEIK